MYNRLRTVSKGNKIKPAGLFRGLISDNYLTIRENLFFFTLKIMYDLLFKMYMIYLFSNKKKVNPVLNKIRTKFNDQNNYPWLNTIYQGERGKKISPLN